MYVFRYMLTHGARILLNRNCHNRPMLFVTSCSKSLNNYTDMEMGKIFSAYVQPFFYWKITTYFFINCATRNLLIIFVSVPTIYMGWADVTYRTARDNYFNHHDCGYKYLICFWLTFAPHFVIVIIFNFPLYLIIILTSMDGGNPSGISSAWKRYEYIEISRTEILTLNMVATYNAENGLRVSRDWFRAQ